MRHHALHHWLIGALMAFLLIGGLGTACDFVLPIFAEPTATATPTLTVTLTPTATPTFTSTPQPTPTPTKGVELPANSSVMAERRADVDTDGVEERIVAFRASGGDGLAIDDWQVKLAAGQKIDELEVRPLDSVTGPKVLLFTSADDSIWKSLYIYAWDGATYVAQGPHEGSLDGEVAFRSRYYPPIVEDGDFNGTEEIMVFLETDNPRYLRVVFYEWDGRLFRHSTMFMAIPRRAPTNAAP